MPDLDTLAKRDPEQVVLVDENDHVLGHMEKLAAHHEGILHRAFSVFVFDGAGDLLLQQRALTKYHSAGLWSNTCCGHPRPGEHVRAAAERRLKEEMGLHCALEEVFAFIYRVELDGGLVEHELDHVFIGRTNKRPRPDPDEVSAFRTIRRAELTTELREHPERFTTWLPLCAERAWESFQPRVKA